MVFNSNLIVFLGLAVLLYSPAEGADVVTCATLAPCIQYSSTCVSTTAGVRRNVCLQVVESSVSGCGVVTGDGVQALCIPTAFPSPLSSAFFTPICVDVVPTGTATFNVDQPNTAIAAAPTDNGAFTISGIASSGTTATVSVQCNFLATVSCPNPSANDAFQITVPTEACACTCTAWVDSTTCSVTCGTGTKTQTRTCSSATGATCTDITTQTVSCTATTATCPTQSCVCMPNWTTWTSCSVTCGGGTRTRSQPCVSTNGVGSCPPQASESEACNTQTCTTPASCSCQEWGSWGTCTKTCGGGTEMRMRTCTGTNCPGTTEIRDCNESSCPQVACDTACSSWTVWTPCTATCSGVNGVKTRSRTCPAGSNCDMSDIEVCFSTASCGSDGGWAVWGNWGSCVPECTGVRQRERVCNNPPPTGNGRFCPGPPIDFGPCPIDLQVCTPITLRPPGGTCAQRQNCRRRCRRRNSQGQRRRCRQRCNQRFGTRRTCAGFFG